MNADAVRADRNAEVLKAARAWHKAGVIGEDSLQAVEAAYPDDRVRLGPVFRALLFLFTLISVNGGLGFALTVLDGLTGNDFPGPFLLVFGVGCAIATDVLITYMRRRQGGIEAALSLAAVGYLIGFVAWILLDQSGLSEETRIPLLFLAAALLLAVAAWRWGYAVYAGAAAAALLGALAALPGGRLFWIALPLSLAPWFARRSESERLPPAHRESWQAVLLVGLAAAYGAVHLGSVDNHLVEGVGGRWEHGGGEVSDAAWWLAVAGTVLFPVLCLAVGIRTRRYPFLLVGLGTAIVSVVTLVHYAGLKPAWAVLLGSGALLTAGIFVLRRYLEAGPGGERHGFTTAPLFEDAARQQWIEAGAAALTFTPELSHLREQPKLSGGGGEFGGGGSSSEF